MKRMKKPTMIPATDIATDAFPSERADFGELTERQCAITTHDARVFNIKNMIYSRCHISTK